MFGFSVRLSSPRLFQLIQHVNTHFAIKFQPAASAGSTAISQTVSLSGRSHAQTSNRFKYRPANPSKPHRALLPIRPLILALNGSLYCWKLPDFHCFGQDG